MPLIIVLNGTSSSGKTSIARELQNRAPFVLLNYSIDNVLYSLPRSSIDRMIEGTPLVGVDYSTLVRGYYGCVQQLALAGLNLVIDNAITTRAHATMLVDAISGRDTLLVGLSCSPEVLAEREEQRGDRRRGLAAQQYPNVHRWLEYDVMIDTAASDPASAAKTILDALAASRSGLARTMEKLLAAG